jgi:hypothetical protein
VELQTRQMPIPHTWADMGSAVASVDLCCPVEVVGLAALLRTAEGVNWLTSSALWMRLDGLASNALRRRLGWLALQWRLRTGLSNLHTASLKGCSIEYLLHARAKNNHHHLFERTQDSSMMPA